MNVGLLVTVETHPCGGINWSCLTLERHETHGITSVHTIIEHVNRELDDMCEIS